MDRITNYLKQFGVIYLGDIVAYNLYHIFIYFILDVTFDKGWGLGDIFYVSLIVGFVFAIPLFITLNIPPIKRYADKLTSNYTYIFISVAIISLLNIIQIEFLLEKIEFYTSSMLVQEIFDFIITPIEYVIVIVITKSLHLVKENDQLKIRN